MNNRDFSDTTKLNVIKLNLEKNRGNICCEICGKKLLSINECHFDHIIPCSKGGKSVSENCQILCVNCNLKKNDKEMQDFVLEETARRFFLGESAELSKQHPDDEELQTHQMTKEIFDKKIKAFIGRKGDIHKVDFSREYNHLPSVHYVKKYYGDLNTLKTSFGIADISYHWNRDTIKTALEKYIEVHGNISQKDLIKKNKLPSLPCILSYYPEYKNFSEIKRGLCYLSVPEKWTIETAVQAGKDYVNNNGKITQSKLRKSNHLPSSGVINSLFGSLAAYQESVGSEVSGRNELITEEAIEKAVKLYFKNEKRVVESMNVFFNTFPYSPSTIQKRFGSFSAFCSKYGIVCLNSKKTKYSKQEVDEAIAQWIKAGHEIPLSKDLAKNGLPSQSVILKYYENWKSPFIFYRKLYEKLS